VQFQDYIFKARHTSRRRTHEIGMKYAVFHTLHVIQLEDRGSTVVMVL